MADQAGPAAGRGPVQTLPPRQLALPWIAITALAAAAWAITVAQARSMGNGPGTMGLTLLPFLGLWVLMMAAMMLPSAAPVAVLYSSWLNRIEAQFTALRYFALDGTGHRSHKEQGSMIRRCIIWRNRHAGDTRLRQVAARASVA
jgi:predicted metal-binding membrane protein